MNILPIPHADYAPQAIKEATLRENMLLFDMQFPTEADCLEELSRRCDGDEALSCKSCGSFDLQREYGGRVSICKFCSKQSWLTAGTFFARIRSARPWLAAIFLLERGVSFNASDLHRLVNIAASTAGQIIKKISMVIHSYLEMEAAAIEVPSGLFFPIIGKRSLETPANKHPIAEQEEMEKRMIENETESIAAVTSSAIVTKGLLSGVAASGLSGHQKAVYELLSTKPVHFEELLQQTKLPVGTLSSTISMLELEGLIKGQAGDHYVLATEEGAAGKQGINTQATYGPDPTIEAHDSIAASIDYVRAGFHGISRKYLQLYLAAHWCYIDSKRWSSNSLLKACNRFREITYADIRAFVSPLLVKLMPC
jgi:hypothetical protein